MANHCPLQKCKRPDNLTQIEIGLSGRFLSGSAGRIRTYDQVVNSHPLCQLSYRGIDKYTKEKTGKNQMPTQPFSTPQQRTINPRSTP